MKLVFTSDSSVQQTGFSLTWSSEYNSSSTNQQPSNFFFIVKMMLKNLTDLDEIVDFKSLVGIILALNLIALLQD